MWGPRGYPYFHFAKWIPGQYPSETRKKLCTQSNEPPKCYEVDKIVPGKPCRHSRRRKEWQTVIHSRRAFAASWRKSPHRSPCDTRQSWRTFSEHFTKSLGWGHYEQIGLQKVMCKVDPENVDTRTSPKSRFGCSRISWFFWKLGWKLPRLYCDRVWNVGVSLYPWVEKAVIKVASRSYTISQNIQSHLFRAKNHGFRLLWSQGGSGCLFHVQGHHH